MLVCVHACPLCTYAPRGPPPLRSLHPRLPRFTNQELCNTLWALVRLRALPNQQLQQQQQHAHGLRAHVSPTATPTTAHMTMLSPMSAATHTVVPMPTASATPGQLESISKPTSTSMPTLTPSLLARIMVEARGRAPGLNHQDVSNLLWAFAQLRPLQGSESAHAFTSEILAALLHRAGQLLPGMPAQNLCMCLWACSVLGYRPPEAWLRESEARTLGLMRDSRAGLGHGGRSRSRVGDVEGLGRPQHVCMLLLGYAR